MPYHAAFFSEGSISIVLDYMDGGSLSDVTRAIGSIPETQLAGFAAQIVSGLRYLHANLRIVHRDVKPSNLLVNKAGRVKISDFGVSGQLANSVTKCNSWVGTVTYMSPERIAGEPYDAKVSMRRRAFAACQPPPLSTPHLHIHYHNR